MAMEVEVKGHACRMMVKGHRMQVARAFAAVGSSCAGGCAFVT
jgi:hypothetical protein